MAPHANRRYDAEVKAFVAYLSSVLGMLLAMVLAAPPAKAFHAMPQTKPAVPTAPLRFEHLSLEDGLSQNAVLSMLQDRQGFLWFGTQDGLNRYDGYNFTVFKTDPENPSSISLASILDIEEDPDGLLWLGTWGGGLNRFDPATGKAVRFQNDPSAADSLGPYGKSVGSPVFRQAAADWMRRRLDVEIDPESALERQQAADQAHLKFRDERSDFLSLVALWEFFTDLGAQNLRLVRLAVVKAVADRDRPHRRLEQRERPRRVERDRQRVGRARATAARERPRRCPARLARGADPVARPVDAA